MAAKRLTLNEVLTALEDDTDFQGADVFITGPDDATKSDEDSGDEDTGANFTNLTVNLLRGEATVTVRTTTGQDNRLEQDSERNDSTDEIVDDTNEDINMDTNEDINMDTNEDINMDTNEQQSSTTDSESTIDYEVHLPQQHGRGRGRGAGVVMGRGRGRGRGVEVVMGRGRGRGAEVVMGQGRGRGRGAGVVVRRGRGRGRPAAAPRTWVRQDMPRTQAANFPWTFEKQNDFFDKDWEPYELFELFFDNEVYSLLKDETIRYARGKGNHTFQISVEELKLFISMLLVSGYVQLPRRRMYWEQQMDVKTEVMSKAMSRKRFEEILKYLHVCDNNELDVNDKMSKVRPLFGLMNERCLKYFPMEQDLSIDEAMVPYFGKHSAKQFIHGKPIRFGFKMWCLNTRLGYLVQFEPYQGAGAGQHELGLGGGVVLDLISELPSAPYRLYFDNFFTSVRLLDRLTEIRIGGTGTMRSNRIEKCPLIPADRLAKMDSGTFDYRYDVEGHTLIAEWNDNSTVFMGTNCHKLMPTNRVQHWSKKQRRVIDVQQPQVIAAYNRYMGGVDRMDQNVSTYRIGVRIKKWWWTLFAFIPDMVVQNAWILYRLTNKYTRHPIDLLEFRRQICRVYLMRYSHRETRGRPCSRVLHIDRRVPPAVRYDGHHHYIMARDTQRRCAHCGGKSTRICSKCDVGLHDRCFAAFHGR